MNKFTEFLKSISGMLGSLPASGTPPAQARICYLSFWCRTGGVNWPLLKQHFDAVEIRAGQGGEGQDELLVEHVDKANEYGVPYLTSWQAAPSSDMGAQGEEYVSCYGVAGHRMSMAFEKVTGGLVTSNQGLAIMQAVSRAAGEDPMGYTSPSILFNDWGYPKWSLEYLWEIAHYPYMFGTTKQYDSVYTFLEERPWSFSWHLPDEFKAVSEMWQISRVIDAREFFSNARTADPDWPNGLLSGTAAVSTIKSVDEYLEWLGSDEDAPDPDPDPEDTGLTEKVAELDERLTEVEEVVFLLSESIEALENMVTVLEQQAHDHEDATDPDPVPDSILVEITDQHPPYYYKGTDASCPDPNKGKPDMLRREGLDPFTVGQPWKVNAQLALSCHDNPATPRITGADGRKYYRIVTEGDYRGRFILADKAQKVEDE